MHLFLTKDGKRLRHTNKKDVQTDQRCSQTVVDANITQGTQTMNKTQDGGPPKKQIGP
jgi:hypothetical protein